MPIFGGAYFHLTPALMPPFLLSVGKLSTRKCLQLLYKSRLAVYNHWTGLVDWTGGLDWWTDTKNHLYAPNETYSPVVLHDAS